MLNAADARRCGLTLIELLLRHPEAVLTHLASARETPPDIRREFPQLVGRVEADVARCQPIDAEAMADAADVVFLALPSPAPMRHVPKLLDAGLRVIDLSADYRLADPAEVQAFLNELTSMLALGE